MEFDAIEMLRERHPAWRLLRAHNASLILSFLGAQFVDGNRGATAEQSLVGALDEHLDLVSAGATDLPFPRSPKEYLDSWSAPESGWLRRFYPHGHRWVREGSPTSARLSRLDRNESDFYDDLLADRLGESVRLEQERVDWNWAHDRLPFS